MYMAPNCAEFSFLYAVGYDTRMVCYWQWCISVLEYMGHARRDKEWSGVWKGPCACPGCLLDSPGRHCLRMNAYNWHRSVPHRGRPQGSPPLIHTSPAPTMTTNPSPPQGRSC